MPCSLPQDGSVGTLQAANVESSGQVSTQHPGATLRRRRRALTWAASTWAASGLVLVLAGVGAIYLLAQWDLRARLVRTDPEAILGDPELRSFALSYARPIYERNCAACHGANMQGDPSYGVKNLAAGDWLYGEGRVSQIEHTIRFGIRASNGRTLNFADMPGFAKPNPYARYRIEPLDPGDIRDVTMFLLVAGGRQGDAAAAARGEQIFNGNGQCFDCHGSDAKGDSAIGAPNLLDGNWLYGSGSFDDIYAVIAYGSSGICPAWFQRLSLVEIRALAVLVHEASRQQAATARSSALAAGARVTP
jgi:cytochrome c oxidase cbb3-type subunit III